MSRERLVDFRSGRIIRQFPHGGEDGSCHLLHLGIINLVGMIRLPVIVLVNTVELKDDRNSLLSVIEMIAPIKEALTIIGIIVFVAESEIEKSLVD